MALLFILVQIHLISLVVCAFVLRLNLPNSVQAVVDKNSTRIDGSFSRRRNHIENVSIRHAFTGVYGGLFFVFIATSLTGLLTANLELPLPRFDAGSEPTHIGSKFDSTVEPSPRKFPWPLIAVYLVSTFMIAPQVISTLYRGAINRYISHGNMRFKEHCGADWQKMKDSESGRLV